ncbi:MAG: site-2 protease family protein, partial [Leptospiraceae bacterium]|nr:site-2 protease family protein [Leptospiraceae bacterium]
AYRAGLRTGDKIFSVNGIPTNNFEDIFLAVTFSKGEEIQVQYERNGETYSANLHPEIFESGRPSIGIEPAAERRVVVNFSYVEQIKYFFKKLFIKQDTQFQSKELNYQYQNLRRRAIEYLQDGDEILSVNGKNIHTVRELQTVLGEFAGQEAIIKVNRKKHPLLTPFIKEEVDVKIPVLGSQILELRNIQDVKFPELKVPFYQLAAHEPNIEQKLSSLRVNGKSFENFSELIQYLEKQQENKIEIEVKALPFHAEFKIRKIGLLGFQADLKMNYPQSEGKNLFQSLLFAFNKISENVSVTFRAFGLMFSGFLSPKDNLTGPVGIVHAAGAVVEHGIHAYLDFFARISIALMIVNLLPIPVADGGHVVLYLYEAIA